MLKPDRADLGIGKAMDRSLAGAKHEAIACEEALKRMMIGRHKLIGGGYQLYSLDNPVGRDTTVFEI
ncbi:hypothetical protein KSF_088970 [Reticulibacter mediterranei]|uniref:Uncharacterized protein n=1 Tax=Reticulibacter mediterranei TaxID=2778369 RepID=A0A8J3INF1_9CHLR|nr:hypothetical protein KSF_088970 [Reticulibacter mediterranei]